jgi:PPOX class F420-dependent enzyme/OxyR family protein
MTSPRSGADAPAARFSTAELDYLLAERRLGRLATIDASGRPHVVPLGWSYNPELGTIDISGRRFAGTRKFRNVAANPRVAFIVDDVAPPWQPCAVMVEGRGHAPDRSRILDVADRRHGRRRRPPGRSPAHSRRLGDRTRSPEG